MDPDFQQRRLQTVRLHLAMEAQATLDDMTRDFPEGPAAMAYFHDLFRRRFTGEQSSDTRPVIGTTCVQVPDELILAAGGRPLRLCSGANTFAQLGAESMPAKSCPLVRATVGMFQTGNIIAGNNLKAVVTSSLCEQKRKAAESLNLDGVTLLSLDLPTTKDHHTARFYWQESVKRLAADLGAICGNKITAARLKRAMAATAAAAGQYRRLLGFLQQTPPLLFGKDLLLVANAYFIDEIEPWTTAVGVLNDELARRQQHNIAACNSRAPRLLLTGSPVVFPNFKLPLLVEAAGGVIVADDLCSSNRLLYDLPHYEEDRLYDMIPALADRYLNPCTCPCLSPNSDRERRLLALADSHKIDGVIYQALSGCLPYEMEQQQIGRRFDLAEIPMLYLETDYSPEDLGQLSTRVEAFLESIKARRRRQAA